MMRYAYAYLRYQYIDLHMMRNKNVMCSLLFKLTILNFFLILINSKYNSSFINMRMLLLL